MPTLSAKELSYIKDFLSWELLMAKKYSQYANQETDAHFKGVFNNAGQVHQQNYLYLLNYLDETVQQQGGMMQ